MLGIPLPFSRDNPNAGFSLTLSVLTPPALTR